MKVLLVNHRFYPVEGGTERWTLGLARALRKRGWGVTVVTQSEPNVPTEEIWEGIEVLRLPMRNVGGFRVPAHYWRTLRRLDYDLLHLSGNRIWCADFYFPVAGILDGPQVITPHDFYQLAMDPSPLNRLYFGHYLPFMLRSFDSYLSLNRAEARRIVDFGYPRERVHLVGEGIEVSEMSRATPPLNLRARWGVTRPLLALYVGGLWENKRIDRVIRALAPVRDRAALAVIGRDVPGSRWNQAQAAALATQLGVEVKFLGTMGREEVISAYREADLFLLGSQYEGFGISLVEAMAAGCPFVSFDVGAAAQLAEGGGGRACATEAEFRAAVSELVLDDAGRRRLGLRARATAPLWDWDAVVERYLVCYAEALAAD